MIAAKGNRCLLLQVIMVLIMSLHKAAINLLLQPRDVGPNRRCRLRASFLCMNVALWNFLWVILCVKVQDMLALYMRPFLSWAQGTLPPTLTRGQMGA